MRVKKRVLSIILAVVMVLGMIPSGFVLADGAPDSGNMTDAEAVEAIYKEFSNKTTYGAAMKTPLTFPLEYEGVTYTNVVTYLKAWAKKNTGKDVEIEYTANKGNAYTYLDWTSGENITQTLVALDDAAETYSLYYKNNGDRTLLGVKDVVFSAGDAKSEKIANIYVKVKSLEKSNADIVDYGVRSLCFARIANGNTSPDNVVTNLGEKNGGSTILPDFSLSTELYSKTFITANWTLENLEGNADAAEITTTTAKKQTLTITRPNVGEGDAKFKLFATVKSAKDANISADSQPINFTVPAFEGVDVTFTVPKDATVSITDPYYKREVDSKYIIKKESASEDYDTYVCTLHTAANGSNLSYNYTVKKDGYLNNNGSVTVSSSGAEEVRIESLVQSGEDDTRLSSLNINSPTGDDLIKGITEFKPDVYEYDVEVKGVQSITFSGDVARNGASVKVTKYYNSLANANKGTVTTGAQALNRTLYLPDAAGTTDIELTVTAPSETSLAEKTRKYIVHVKKTEETGLLTKLIVSTTSSMGGSTNGSIGFEGVANEEALSFVAGGYNPGVYTVNYWRDKVKVTPTATGCTIKVGDETVASGKASSEINLAVGDNEIPITVTKGDKTINYKLVVHRKAEFYITSYGVDGNELASFESTGKNWSATAAATFAYGTEDANVIVNTNDKDADVTIQYGGKDYRTKSGKAVAIPTDGADKLILTIYITHTVNGVKEGQKFTYSIARGKNYYASGLESYLPAPGQFVNGGNSWGNPVTTLTNNGGVTLGAFGGNIVYKFEEPITNDSKNPYGVDFIVVGNVFNNSDGSSAVGASEPASVMVSKDGVTWYELAGSLYYEDSSIHNYTVTYTNSDPDFKGAVNVSWVDNLGNTGAVLANSYHSQSYYPNPAYYSKFQGGAGANSSYKIGSVSFTGTKITESNQPVFGYGDNHYSPSSGKDNTASNPYAKNHLMGCNGDGFDLAWAVDANGNPVHLDSVNYVKIYNPQLMDGGATGEVSPEICAILRAKSADADCGTSTGLTGLEVNGADVALSASSNVIDVNIGKATTANIAPVAEGANIYINNARVESGESLANVKVAAGVTKTVRIVVQDGEKAPAIYLLNLKSDALTQEEINAQAAADVDELIAAIGEVTVKQKSAIEEARAAYDKLTESQKKLVTKLDVLTKAEKALEEILKTEVGTVTVIVENTTFDQTKAANENITWKDSYWTGRLLTKELTIKPDDTMHSVVVRALSQAEYTQKSDNTGYISAINGLAAGDGGQLSGWMCTLNDWFISQGMPAYTVADGTLEDGDVVRIVYTTDMGLDVGSIYNSKDTGLESLKSDVGTLSPAFDKGEEKYILSVPYGTKKVFFSATAVNKNFDVKISVGGKTYKASKGLPVKDGDVVSITVGSGPSMSEGTPTTYSVLIETQGTATDNVKKVVDKIDAIGTVTLESKDAITGARISYDALTEEEKKNVGNYNILTEAEKTYKRLEEEAAKKEKEKQVSPEVKTVLDATAAYLKTKGTPDVGSVGGDWMAFGMARAGQEVGDAYFNKVAKYVKAYCGENNRLDATRSTENSRVIIALTALGYDVTSVGGHNLLAGLDNMEFVGKQGLNGYIWALIALDSGNYKTSGNVTRDALVNVILKAQLADKGWALMGDAADADITAMALLALAPYVNTNAEVKTAVDAAIERLSMMQNANGSFGSVDGASAESCAQVVTALSALGIDADADARFIKNGTSVLDALCLYAVEGGGFKHILAGKLDGMATEQGYYALVAYERFKAGKNTLFDMSDVTRKNNPEITADTEPVVLDMEIVNDALTDVSLAIDAIDNAAAEGKTLGTQTVTIPMKNKDGSVATVVPVDVLNEICGKDIEVVLDMGEYSWTINGNNITAKNIAAINLEVKKVSGVVPGDVVEGLVREGEEAVQIRLTHEGDFGFEAVLKYNFGAENAGKHANAFWYKADGTTEFTSSGLIDKDGFAELKFSHASDYVVVISKENKAESVLNEEMLTGGGQTGDGFNPAMWFVVIAACIVAGGVAAVRFRRDRNSKK
ncbi:MAG: DUF4430 domain-containing protein [Lachnospiraceae bacterium]|nr:DUF4430 domain-containing protein [Lachnospiraceae bacterium]